MSIFSSDITEDQLQHAIVRIDELSSIPYELMIKSEAKELKACKDIVERHKKQIADAEKNLKAGLKAALGILKKFLPKEAASKIPENAIDMLFGLLHKPQIIVDKINGSWQEWCDGMGIPSECIRIVQQKPGRDADIEAVIGVYNPNLKEWIWLEQSFRAGIDLIRPGNQYNGEGAALGASLRESIIEAYNVPKRNTLSA